MRPHLRGVFAIPGDLAAPTGGYAYARRVLALLPGLRVLTLPDSFPEPSQADLAETHRLLDSVPPDCPLLIDGLAYGALPLSVLTGIRAPIAVLVHHPLCLESGIPPARAAELHALERAALSRAASVIATSTDTAETLIADFAVPPSRLSVAPPGTEPAARAACAGSPPHLLAIGAMSPRKGYRILVGALAMLRDLPWHLSIVGALDRNPGEATALAAEIAANSLQNRITLAGVLSDTALAALTRTADIFVIASLHEGYGMAAADALAHGLPIVATNAGALAQTIPDAACLRAEPSDAVSLAAALRRMLTDPTCRSACADASWLAGQSLPRWDDTARAIAAVLDSLRSKRMMTEGGTPEV